MQEQAELDKFYQTPDPWAYQKTDDDWKRRDRILGVLRKYGPYKRLLDIGAGEGWLTRSLPAREKHAIELSDVAASRFPSGVNRVFVPEGKYDLVVLTGVLYAQYDWQTMKHTALDAAKSYLLTSHIKEWEVTTFPFRVIEEQTFPYREFEQHLILYDTTTPQN